MDFIFDESYCVVIETNNTCGENEKMTEKGLNNNNFIEFLNSLTETSKYYNIAINSDVANAPDDKKICYASDDRLHYIKSHIRFLREIEALTASTGIMLSGEISFIDLNGLAKFDSYKTESNHLTATATDFSLRNIKQTRVHKFMFIRY